MVAILHFQMVNNIEMVDDVWVEVLPVKWLVDEKSRMMITEKLIFAGVQFNKERKLPHKRF